MIKFALIMVLSLFMLGLIDKLKAFLVGKAGASVFQYYYDFIKLVKKGEVISHTTSCVFQIMPTINMVSVILAGLIVCCIHFEGDFILFSYILAFSKFFTVISALDTSSPFEGMGASREVSYTSFVEPSFFIIISSVCALNGIYSFETLFSLLLKNNFLIAIILVLVLFMMILIEGSRVPIDDPKTHLELTMIHEAMILDNSGIDLAYIIYANAIKMMLFVAIISNIVFSSAIWGLIISMIVVSVLIAILETISARIRLTHIIEYTFIIVSLALVVMALMITALSHGGIL